MKKIVSVSLLIILSLTSCAQRKQKNNFSPDMDINAILENDPYIDQLQKYDYEPEYVIKIRSHYAYEIRVNDMPAANNFSTSTGTIWYPINDNILKKGKQSLSIHIYPRYTDDETQKTHLEDPSDYDFELWIEQSAWVNGSKEEPKTVLQYEIPKIDENGNEIDFYQLRSHHEELTFNATVPYILTGWSDSKVFKKKDSVELEKRVVEFYKNYRQLMVDKKPLKLEILGFKQAYEMAQSTYTDKDKLFEDRKKYINDFAKEKFIMARLENHKMIYYGDNRVVGLVFKNNPDKGESAIAKKFLNESGQRRITYYSLLLHQPKGSDSLEIIR
ncbi:hypothetical protein [uncultured Aquimarina sp.]|uniref:hypothetical protein n=1 Tax=uncultured Aquimarina sp. TaxID=575652 RepID=UPI00261307AD|nr:hypothetical protein [uncultured Aquimarina sp.]